MAFIGSIANILSHKNAIAFILVIWGHWFFPILSTRAQMLLRKNKMKSFLFLVKEKSRSHLKFIYLFIANCRILVTLNNFYIFRHFSVRLCWIIFFYAFALYFVVIEFGNRFSLGYHFQTNIHLYILQREIENILEQKEFFHLRIPRLCRECCNKMEKRNCHSFVPLSKSVKRVFILSIFFLFCVTLDIVKHMLWHRHSNIRMSEKEREKWAYYVTQC